VAPVDLVQRVIKDIVLLGLAYHSQERGGEGMISLLDPQPSRG
jgi:hypothetical protein